MNDAQLQQLYRRMTARSALPDAERVAEPLSRHGYPDVEGTALDQVAASAAAADVLRTALALAPDAEALARAVASGRSARAPRPRPVLRWAAMAAGLGAVAVLVTSMQTPPATMARQAAPEVMALDPADVILSASFESLPAADRSDIDEAGAIFRGDFGS